MDSRKSLSDAELREHIRIYVETRRESSFLAIYNQYIRLVRFHANQVYRAYFRRLHHHADLCDLEGLGLMGLMDAVHRYRPDAGSSVTAYINRAIRNRVLRSVQSASTQGRREQDLVSLYDRVRVKNGQVIHVADQIEDPRQAPSRLYDRLDAEDKWILVNQARARLPQHYQDVLRLRIEGRTLDAIGRLYGQSRQNIQGVYQRSVRLIREAVADPRAPLSIDMNRVREWVPIQPIPGTEIPGTGKSQRSMDR